MFEAVGPYPKETSLVARALLSLAIFVHFYEHFSPFWPNSPKP